MKLKILSRLPWLLWVAFFIVLGIGLYLTSLNPDFELISLLTPVVLIGYPTVGALIASRQPRNAIGWIFLTFGLGPAIYIFSRGYATYALVTSPGALPGARWFAWLQTWITLPTFALGLTFLLLLYPNGRLLTYRWRSFARLAALAVGMLVFLGAFQPGLLEGFEGVANPVGLRVLDRLGDAPWLLFPVLLVCGLVSVTALVIRFRRSRGDERLQLKWFTYLVVMMFLIAPIGTIGLTFGVGWSIMPFVTAFMFAALPAAVGIAILKHRLYDVDLVINKTILYGLLGSLIALVYAGIVVGISAGFFGLGGATGQIAATAGVAVVFQPAKQKLQRFANRLVYGKRATPYEVMSDLSRAMAATISADDLLPRMAEAVGHGVRAAQTRIKVALPEGADMQAFYPPDSSEQELEHILLVTHLGETVGEVAVGIRSGDSLGAADHRLLADFAAQAGLAFHNIRLAAELEAQVAEVTLQAQELTRSSERIIAAQNEERRRLERDIHSGPQEHLNAMRSKIVEVEEALGLDIDRAIETLGDLASHSRKTLEMLRDLARGIFPQLLSDKGLIFALEAQAAKSSVQVEVRASLDLNAVRFDPKVEAAVYFCCIEATSEALGPSTISIHFDGENLQFVVESELALTVDFQNMSDRIEALGGTLEMDRDLTGRVPALVLTSA